MTTDADLARIAREAREAREREAELVAADAVTPPLTECLERGPSLHTASEGSGHASIQR